MGKEYIITRRSTIVRNNKDGKDHSRVTRREKPCDEAYISDIIDVDGNVQSRYFIELETIDDLFALEKKYRLNTLLRTNKEFPDYIAIIMDDL